MGVDLGIKTFVQLSTGQSFEGAKPHTKKLKQLRRLSRNLSRKKKGGQNFKKSALVLSKLHKKIADIRNDSLHKITTAIVLNHSRICIEDLNVAGMVKNRKAEFRRQLAYKAAWYKSELIVADRFFPSSKMCHACHGINDNLTLADRHWSCDCCGITHDRDLNAAINLENYTVSSTEINACGVEGSGATTLVVTRNHATLKQEFNTESI